MTAVNSVVRLRIELSNRPGSLGRVASVIGQHGGNITGIDVLQGEGDLVIDEVTVEVDDSFDIVSLRKAIDRGGDARVLSHQRAQVVDTIVRVLRRAAEAVDATKVDACAALRQSIADLCATPAAWVLPASAVGSLKPAQMALEHPGSAVVVRTTERLPALGETVTGEACVLAVAATTGGGQIVALVARPTGQGFTPTECERIEALVAFHQRLAGSAS